MKGQFQSGVFFRSHVKLSYDKSLLFFYFSISMFQYVDFHNSPHLTQSVTYSVFTGVSLHLISLLLMLKVTKLCNFYHKCLYM